MQSRWPAVKIRSMSIEIEDAVKSCEPHASHHPLRKLREGFGTLSRIRAGNLGTLLYLPLSKEEFGHIKYPSQ